MTIQELESAASRGFKRDEESNSPSHDEIIAVFEIKNKADELLKELQQHDRFDKDVIARKTSGMLWFCARIAGMYGVNLQEAVKRLAEEAKNGPPVATETPSAGTAAERTVNEKTVQRPKRKLANFPKIGKFARPRGASGFNRRPPKTP